MELYGTFFYLIYSLNCGVRLCMGYILFVLLGIHPWDLFYSALLLWRSLCEIQNV